MRNCAEIFRAIFRNISKYFPTILDLENVNSVIFFFQNRINRMTNFNV